MRNLNLVPVGRISDTEKSALTSRILIYFGVRRRNRLRENSKYGKSIYYLYLITHQKVIWGLFRFEKFVIWRALRGPIWWV